MPAQPSRRQVLRYSALAAGALALGLPAGADEQTPFTFALVSDTHLGRGGDVPAQNLAKIIQQINDSPAEFTLFCGDLVNGGQDPKNQVHYPTWRKLADTLAKPWHAVPGNHDPVAMFKQHIAPQTDSTVDRPPFRFICFMDAQQNPSHDGAVSQQQIDWIQKQISDAADKNLRSILIAHITHHDNSPPNRGWMIQEGRKAFADMLQRNRANLAAFFAGHFHYGLMAWTISKDNPLHQIVLPSACWNEKRDLKPSTDHFIDDDFNPAYVLVEASPARLSVSYKPIDGSARRAFVLLPPQ